jgi:hypothetical protein
LVHRNFARVSNDFRAELLRQYGEWKSSSGNTESDDKLTGAYDEILELQLDRMKQRVLSFVSEYGRKLRQELIDKQLDGQAWGKQAKEVTNLLEDQVSKMKLETSGFDGF